MGLHAEDVCPFTNGIATAAKAAAAIKVLIMLICSDNCGCFKIGYVIELKQ
jgi:hypothetical protein